MLHPTTLHCWDGGVHVYDHFYDIIVNQNGWNPKSYLLNIVYNFGGLFEASRELWLFFKEDPRGQLTNVHDAGYNAGQFVYNIITPSLATYDTDAISADIKNQADLDALKEKTEGGEIDTTQQQQS